MTSDETGRPAPSHHVALLICLMLALVWVSYTSARLPTEWGWDTAKVKPTPMWLAQLVSIPLTTLLLYSLYRARHASRLTIAAFLGYALWFLGLFLGFAPGCMTEDSYYTFSMVRNGWWNAWYSALHPALMTALVQIFPYEFFAPGAFLALLWAATYTLVHMLLRYMAAPLPCHAAVPLLVLLPAQVAASMIVIRDGFFTAFYIVFLLAVVWAFLSRPTQKRTLVAIGALGALLMIYRSDAIPAVAIGLYAVLALGPWRELGSWRGAQARRQRLKAAMPILSPMLIAWLFSLLVPHLLDNRWVRGNTWDARAKHEYKLTLIESPLGYILRHGGSRITTGEKAAIERVFRFDDLRQHYCPGNLCVFYGGMWNKASTRKERDDAFRAALAVFAKHPVLFVQSRIATLNTVGDENTQTQCSRAIMMEKGYRPLFLTQPLFDFGQSMVDYVRRTERVDGILGGSRVWWNVYVNAAIALLVMFSAAWTPAVSLATLLLLTRSAAVAAMAPAGFTVYYLTLFIGTPLLVILWAAELARRRRSVRTT